MTAKSASEQLTRITVLQNLDSVLEEFGLDAGVVLGRLGMDAAVLCDRDIVVSTNRVIDALEYCANITQCQDFALKLVEAQNESFLGALALFLQTSATLGEALYEIGKYTRIHHAQPAIWRVNDLGNAVMFNFHLDIAGLLPFQHRLAVDLSLGHAFRVIDFLTAGRVRPLRVLLRGDHSEETRSYRRFFHAPVEFNAETDGLLLPADCLGFPLNNSDSRMHEALRLQISSIEGEDSSLVREVRTIIRALLPTGDSSLEKVAKCYACDKRSLQRYLREEGDTTYQALLDEVRFDLVLQYLRDSLMPVTQLTYVAGFSDPSNFARAFRKRFTISPTEWRAQHRERLRASTNRRSQLSRSLQ